MTPIAPLIETFLDETLTRQRGVSRHTRDSYALASNCSSCSQQKD
jgi:hypothetical protein